MTSNLLISIIISLSIPILFGLFKKIFPTIESDYKSTKTLDQLRKEFFKYDLFTLFGFFITTPLITYLMCEIFMIISDFRYSFFNEAEYIVKPTLVFWLIPSFFGGMLVSIILFTKLQKIIWSVEKILDYRSYYNLKYGFNANKILLILLKGIGLFVITFAILALNWYSVFNKNEIKISPYFSLIESEYTYSDILELKEIEKLEAPNGKIVEDLHYIIDLEDGRKWNSRESGFDDIQKNKELIYFISEKTSHKINHYEFDYSK